MIQSSKNVIFFLERKEINRLRWTQSKNTFLFSTKLKTKSTILILKLPSNRASALGFIASQILSLYNISYHSNVHNVFMILWVSQSFKKVESWLHIRRNHYSTGAKPRCQSVMCAVPTPTNTNCAFRPTHCTASAHVGIPSPSPSVRLQPSEVSGNLIAASLGNWHSQHRERWNIMEDDILQRADWDIWMVQGEDLSGLLSSPPPPGKGFTKCQPGRDFLSN